MFDFREVSNATQCVVHTQFEYVLQHIKISLAWNHIETSKLNREESNQLATTESSAKKYTNDMN